jgi:hypothetical protein
MTASIDPLQPQGASGAQRTTTGAGQQTAGLFAAALEKARQESALPAVEPTPPPELIEHIARAARAWEALNARGQHVSFDESASGDLQIVLAADDGRDPQTLSGAELFSLLEREGGE